MGVSVEFVGLGDNQMIVRASVRCAWGIEGAIRFGYRQSRNKDGLD